MPGRRLRISYKPAGEHLGHHRVTVRETCRAKEKGEGSYLRGASVTHNPCAWSLLEKTASDGGPLQTESNGAPDDGQKPAPLYITIPSCYSLDANL
jgi:hypothetical protein